MYRLTSVFDNLSITPHPLNNYGVETKLVNQLSRNILDSCDLKSCYPIIYNTIYPDPTDEQMQSALDDIDKMDISSVDPTDEEMDKAISEIDEQMLSNFLLSNFLLSKN